jgi:MATE family multidrug resistance protein
MAGVTALAILIDDVRRPVWSPGAFRPDRSVLGELVRLGWPAAGQLVLEYGVFGVATLLAGRLGTVPLAAHEIGLNVCGFTFMVPLGVSSAGAVRVGHALGRGDPHSAARAGRAALALGVGFMAASALALLVARRPILSVFTTDPAVVALGARLLLIGAVFQLFDGLQVVTTGILRGAGDTRTAMAFNVVAHWGLGLPVAAALAFGAGWGVFGLWLGLCLGLTVLGVALLRGSCVLGIRF